jgi:hypothetical protein
MASVVLNSDPDSDQLYADGLLVGGGGIVSRGPLLVTKPSGLLVAPEQALNAEIRVRAVGDGQTGNDASVTWTEGYLTSASTIDWAWLLGVGGVPVGAVPEGKFVLAGYVGGGFSQNVCSVEPNPRGSAGPPIIPAASSLFNIISSVQSGVATIPLGAATVSVALTSITANAVVIAVGVGAHDTTALYFNVTITAGTGFAITSNANATAAKNVKWFVVHI